MNNLEKYNELFKKALGLNADTPVEQFVNRERDWDSVTHMEIIAELEDQFNIMLSPSDILDLDSYKKGIEILKKYNITLE